VDNAYKDRKAGGLLDEDVDSGSTPGKYPELSNRKTGASVHNPVRLVATHHARIGTREGRIEWTQND